MMSFNCDNIDFFWSEALMNSYVVLIFKNDRKFIIDVVVSKNTSKCEILGKNE